MRFFSPRTLIVLLLIPFAFGAHQLRQNPDEQVGIRHRSRVTTSVVERAPDPPEVSTANVAAWLDGVARQAWIDGERRAEWDAGVARAEAERQAQAAANRAQSAPRSVGGIVGDCTGFPIPSYIIQRESGGNPNAFNPSSGAIGCSQTLLSHYNGGVCSGLNPYTVDGQRACTQILYDRGGLAPWALTR